LIPTFSPQGDGNLINLPTELSSSQVDPYLFPARGRKRSVVPARSVPSYT